MSTIKNPVGPQSPRVYWRRRLVVGLGLLAVIIAIFLIIAQPGAGSPAEKADAPAATETASPTDAPVQEEGDVCTPANIAVEAITDQNQYAAGVNPLISLSVTNNGPVACILNVGTTQQLFEITSGEETYWKSTDCQTDPIDVDQLLEPGVAQTTEPIPWDRTRSDPSTCAADRSAVPANGATYHLTVSLGEIVSEGTAPFLLY